MERPKLRGPPPAHDDDNVSWDDLDDAIKVCRRQSMESHATFLSNLSEEGSDGNANILTQYGHASLGALGNHAASHAAGHAAGQGSNSNFAHNNARHPARTRGGSEALPPVDGDDDESFSELDFYNDDEHPPHGRHSGQGHHQSQLHAQLQRQQLMQMSHQPQMPHQPHPRYAYPPNAPNMHAAPAPPKPPPTLQPPSYTQPLNDMYEANFNSFSSYNNYNVSGSYTSNGSGGAPPRLSRRGASASSTNSYSMRLDSSLRGSETSWDDLGDEIAVALRQSMMLSGGTQGAMPVGVPGGAPGSAHANIHGNMQGNMHGNIHGSMHGNMQSNMQGNMQGSAGLSQSLQSAAMANMAGMPPSWEGNQRMPITAMAPPVHDINGYVAAAGGRHAVSAINDDGSWNCAACTFLNENPLHLVCAICGTAKATQPPPPSLPQHHHHLLSQPLSHSPPQSSLIHHLPQSHLSQSHLSQSHLSSSHLSDRFIPEYSSRRTGNRNSFGRSSGRSGGGSDAENSFGSYHSREGSRDASRDPSRGRDFVSGRDSGRERDEGRQNKPRRRRDRNAGMSCASASGMSGSSGAADRRRRKHRSKSRNSRRNNAGSAMGSSKRYSMNHYRSNSRMEYDYGDGDSYGSDERIGGRVGAGDLDDEDCSDLSDEETLLPDDATIKTMQTIKTLRVPEGEVTIIYTDVQGSTSLWEADPASMKKATDIHDSVIRKCYADHGGYEITTEGDAFNLAFQHPADAIGFALKAQLQLYRARWPEGTLRHPDGCHNEKKAFRGFRVRMGMHHGPTTSCVHDTTGRTIYQGEAVDIAKAIEKMSHGGQILTTVETWRAVSGMAEQFLGKPQVMDCGEHLLWDPKKAKSKISSKLSSKRIVQLVPNQLAYDFFAARGGQHVEEGQSPPRVCGRVFPPLLSNGQLSTSFLNAPYLGNRVAMVFVYTDKMESISDRERSKNHFLLAKYIRSHLMRLTPPGYECQEDRGSWMLAFDRIENGIKFGLNLNDTVFKSPDLRGDIDKKKLFRIGIHWGPFLSMGPHTITGHADYFGPIVNRAARVAAQCEPGQVCVGVPMGDDEEPPDPGPTVEVEVLGVKQLKGISTEMAIFACRRREKEHRKDDNKDKDKKDDHKRDEKEQKKEDREHKDRKDDRDRREERDKDHKDRDKDRRKSDRDKDSKEGEKEHKVNTKK